MLAAAGARALRAFTLGPAFRGKSRIEARLERHVRAPEMARFPAGFRMRLDPSSPFERSVYLHNGEPDTRAFLETTLKPGMTFWDVGANIGFYALLGSRLVGEHGQVHAFEPHPATFERLTANIALNGALNVDARKEALGDRDGSAPFFERSPGMHEQSSLAPSDDWREVGRVPLVTVDGLVAAGLRRPAVVKIDVEGAEMMILRGAAKTFHASPPVLVVELATSLLARFDTTPVEVVEAIHALGPYEALWPYQGRLIPVSRWDPLPHAAKLGADHGSNYVFRPRG